MAKTFIFAIGGTGARVLRSLTMLMAAGFKDENGNPFCGTICPIIIDYDKDNGDKTRAIESMKRYMAVHNLVMTGKNAGLEKELTDGKAPFFTPKFEDILDNNWSWNFGVENKKCTFREYISYDQLGNTSRRTQDLVKCMYDTDRETKYAELDLEMTQGFQGNPNIGSVVFDDLKNCEEFKTRFVNSFRNGDRIVVVGSIFGGTGSSGIPKIIAAIRNNSRTDIKNAEISVVLVLPYFVVGETNEGEISIKSSIFNSKTKAALTYYETSGLFGSNGVNNVFFVGDKVPTKVKPHIGDKAQKNNAHIVELISAMSILKVMTDRINSEFGKKYKFNASNLIVDGIGIAELVGESQQWQDNIFVRNIIHGLINFTYGVKYFLDEIVTNDERMNQRQFYKELHLDEAENKTISSGGKLPIQDYCAAFYAFICKDKTNQDFDDGFWQWLTELHAENHGPHRLKIFNLMNNCHISDFLEDVKFRSKPIEMPGIKIKIRPEKPILVYDEAFDSEMNNNLAPYRQGQKKLEGKDLKTYPWIFNHVLYEMTESIRIFKAGDKLLPEKFKLVP